MKKYFILSAIALLVLSGCSTARDNGATDTTVQTPSKEQVDESDSDAITAEYADEDASVGATSTTSVDAQDVPPAPTTGPDGQPATEPTIDPNVAPLETYKSADDVVRDVDDLMSELDNI